MADKNIASLKATVKIDYNNKTLSKLKADLTVIDKRLKGIQSSAKVFGNVLNAAFLKPQANIKKLTKDVRAFNTVMKAGSKAQDDFVKDRTKLKFNTKNITKVQKDLEKIENLLRNIVVLSREAFNYSKSLNNIQGKVFKSTQAVNKRLRAQATALRSTTKEIKAYNRASTIAGGRGAVSQPGGGSGKKNPFFQPGVSGRVEGAFLREIGRFRTAKGLLLEVGGIIASMTLAIPTLSSAFLFLTSRINGTTTEMSKLSKATGVSLTWMQGMTAIAKELGFNFENVNSLVEELNNKVGGQLKGFDEINLLEGLNQLGMTFEEIKDLKPEDQFNLIAKRTQELARSGVSIQEIGSAWDKIFGGEGNRIGANIAVMKDDFTEIQKRMESITKLSDVAVKGAERYTKRFNELTAIMGKFAQEFFGKFGSQMAPILKDTVDFLMRNSKEIVSFLSQAAVGIANIMAEAIEYMLDILKWGLKNREMFMTLIDDAREWLRIMTYISTALIYIGELFVKLKLSNPWTWLIAGALKFLGIWAAIKTGVASLLGLVSGVGLATNIGIVGAKILSWIAALFSSGPLAPVAIAAAIITGLTMAMDYFFPEFMGRFRTGLSELWGGFVGLLHATFVHIPSLFWNGMVDGLANFVSQLAAGIYSAMPGSSIMEAAADAGDWIKAKYKGAFGDSNSSNVSNTTNSTVNSITNNFSMSGQAAALTMRRASTGGIQ